MGGVWTTAGAQARFSNRIACFGASTAVFMKENFTDSGVLLHAVDSNVEVYGDVKTFSKTNFLFRFDS